MPAKRQAAFESPHVNHIIHTLEARIHAGTYPAGQWLPPERALCDEFSVSRATLRLALVELEQRQLLLRAPGCRPLVRAQDRAVVRRHSATRGNIGLWVKHDPKYSGTYLITRGVQRAADTDSFRVIVAETHAETLQALGEAEAQALARMVRDQDMAGVVLWYSGLAANLPVLQSLRAANIPMVFVDRHPPESFEADYVGIDNAGAAQEAVGYLLARGHRRIVHITNPEPVSAVYDRLLGYRQALTAAGVSVPPEWILMGRVEGLAEEGMTAEEIVERLLHLPEPPTAIFAVTDYIALAVVRALQRRGLRVPEDMAVVGFDDLEQWLPHEPFLTTVRQPFESIGYKAVQLLFKRLEGGPTYTYRHLLLDASLIVRRSA